MLVLILRPLSFNFTCVNEWLTQTQTQTITQFNPLTGWMCFKWVLMGVLLVPCCVQIPSRSHPKS